MNRKTLLLIIVASLGYFVDIYDITLFGIVKQESLESFMPHATEAKNAIITQTGMFLFNMQMIGMLIGGLLWGILGDKKGRLTVLFGSILLYSLANILNAFVFDVNLYAMTRILAGIGLAGELGAGITLVSELMSKENRGYGTMIIVTFGALGAVTAEMVHRSSTGLAGWVNELFGSHLLGWQVVYILGGIMGLLLLAMRIGSMESGMFKKAREENVRKGNIWMLFTKKNFPKYLKCILIGVPVWYVIGILVFNSQKTFGPALGVIPDVVDGKEVNVINGVAIMYAYIGLSVGDLISGLLSQILKSRKKVVFIYLAFTLILVLYFLFFARGISVSMYYFFAFLLGASTGYWAIFVTIASEQFGTNIRSTVTNTVPNFVRGSVVLISALYNGIIAAGTTNITSALIVGIICLAVGLWAIMSLNETFSKDLDYLEGHE
jgi:putative MFS transporter